MNGAEPLGPPGQLALLPRLLEPAVGAAAVGAAAIAAAGAQLGYVHLDDNDGRNDSHLALLDGVMSAETLCRTFAALQSRNVVL